MFCVHHVTYIPHACCVLVFVQVSGPGLTLKSTNSMAHTQFLEPISQMNPMPYAYNVCVISVPDIRFDVVVYHWCVTLLIYSTICSML